MGKGKQTFYNEHNEELTSLAEIFTSQTSLHSTRSLQSAATDVTQNVWPVTLLSTSRRLTGECDVTTGCTFFPYSSLFRVTALLPFPPVFLTLRRMANPFVCVISHS